MSEVDPEPFKTDAHCPEACILKVFSRGKGGGLIIWHKDPEASRVRVLETKRNTTWPEIAEWLQQLHPRAAGDE